MNIVVTDLKKSFGDNVVLDGFSAEIKENSVTCIMGPSGCGKTTLINIFMGLMAPDSGTVTGVPELKSTVFQEDRLCESFNAVTNVALVGDKNVDRIMIKAHLKSIGIDDFKKPVGEFSGGMKRRVAVVRAIFAESDILFLDEPFKGLDEDNKIKTMQYVKDHIDGRTVILVTHSHDEAEQFGDRLIKM